MLNLITGAKVSASRTNSDGLSSSPCTERKRRWFFACVQLLPLL